MRGRCFALLLVVSGLMPEVSSAATPPEGVALVVRRGFFTETDLGGFLTLGGDDGYSNLQSYLQLGVGYDVSRTVELGVHFGLGANAQNCFAGKNPAGQCTQSDNFTVAMLNASAAYLFRLAERFYLTPKVSAGYTLLDPPPVVIGSGAGAEELRSGANVALGLGVEYATEMDHFSIGFDVMGRYILVGPNILSLQFYPRVKYTF